MNPAVMQYLDASTAHLPQHERDGLQSGELLDNKTPRVIPHEYGWWVNVPDEIDEDDFERAPALLAVVRFARRHNCNWINFDVDARIVDRLQSYDEENE